MFKKENYMVCYNKLPLVGEWRRRIERGRGGGCGGGGREGGKGEGGNNVV